MKSPSIPNPFSFLEHLERRLAANATLPKRARTRERLRIATIRVLSERGYEEMRTLTITEMAGLSEGLFYVYFKSKVEITLDILREFHVEFMELGKIKRSRATPFEVIQATNRRWIHIAVANPGLMRCVFQAGNEVPEFADLMSVLNKTWYTRVLTSVQRRRPSAGRGTLMLPLYMLGGMMDELVRKLVVYPDPEFLGVIKENGLDNDAIADAASMIWYRVLYLDGKIPDNLSEKARRFIGHL